MVEIICPHCEKEIALDDDASGEFGCPYCDGEFEWNVEPDEKFEKQHTLKGTETSALRNGIVGTLRAALSGSLLLSGTLMIIACFVGLNLSSMLWESTSGSSEAAGAGIVAVMGIALLGFVLSGGIGLLGLAIVFSGLLSLIRK